MVIYLKHPARIDGQMHYPGEAVDIPDEQALSLVEKKAGYIIGAGTGDDTDTGGDQGGGVSDLPGGTDNTGEASVGDDPDALRDRPDAGGAGGKRGAKAP